MRKSITITQAEAVRFIGYIHQKIIEYTVQATDALKTENESEYHLWADAVSYLETLERSLTQRLSGGEHDD